MKKIAVLTPFNYDQCETFIKSHIDNIPHEVIVIHGNGTHRPHLTNHTKRTIVDKLNFRYIKFRYRFFNKKGNVDLKLKEFLLKQTLKQHKVDLVFAEFLTVGGFATKVCEDLKIPIIATALGFDISRKQVIENNKEKYKRLFNYCNNIIVVSNHMRKNLLELGCENEKIVYSPIGPDKSFYQLKPSFNNNNIFALGRFVDKKAPHLLILSFVAVLKVIPDARLTIGGDGPLFNACLDLVKYYHISHSVDLIGKITQKEQMKYLQNSSVFVQHSKTAIDGDSEGTPVAILEASAASLPIVSTLHAGIPEVVVNDKTGYLVEEGNVKKMSEKMIYLLSDKQNAQSMGRKGRKHIKENFSLENHIQLINEIIRKSVKSPENQYN